jgi:hypothetical protein
VPNRATSIFPLRATLTVLLISTLSVSAANPSIAVALQDPATAHQLDPKWLIAQGGLLVTVLVLLRLLSNRERADREFKKDIALILRENAQATLTHAVNTARNTEELRHNTASNQALATEVRTLAERRAEERE